MSYESLEITEQELLMYEEGDAAFTGGSSGEGGSKIVSRLSLLILPLVVFACFVAVWYLLSWRMLPTVLGRDTPPELLRSIILPYPHDVVNVALLDPSNLGDILSGLWLDIRLAFIGLAIATVLGVTSAIAMSQARWIERSFYPYAVFLQTVPILALVPAIGLFLGFGFSARLVVVVILSLFPIITNTLFGLKSTDPGLDDLFTLHSNSRRVRLWKLQLPGSIPAMFIGFQIAAGLSVVGAIVGDFFFGRGEKGLGNLIQIYANQLQPEQLWGTVFFSTLLGLFAFLTFGWLRTRLIGHWHESVGRRE